MGGGGGVTDSRSTGLDGNGDREQVNWAGWKWEGGGG